LRAVVITQPGDLDVLQVAARPAREPGAGELRIAVKAASVNPTDIGLRERGGPPDLPAPWVPGMDAAGVVESVGPGFARLSVGEEVMARSALAGQAVRSRAARGAAASVVPIPDGATAGQAATLPMNSLTLASSSTCLGCSQGDARGDRWRRPARVVRDHARQGAGAARDRRRQTQDGSWASAPTWSCLAAGAPRRGAGGRAGARRGVRHRAAPARVPGDPRRQPDRGRARLGRRRVEDRGIRVRAVFVSTRSVDRWLEVRALASSPERIKLRVAKEFPPEQAAEAQRLMDAGGLRGRAVIVF
jgi:NADPH:quinone reductase-like Zn-dependent oxidoreductase